MIDARDAEDAIRLARETLDHMSEVTRSRLVAIKRDRAVPRVLRIEATAVLAMVPQ